MPRYEAYGSQPRTQVLFVTGTNQKEIARGDLWTKDSILALRKLIGLALWRMNDDSRLQERLKPTNSGYQRSQTSLVPPYFNRPRAHAKAVLCRHAPLECTLHSSIRRGVGRKRVRTASSRKVHATCGSMRPTIMRRSQSSMLRGVEDSHCVQWRTAGNFGAKRGS